LRIVFFGTPDFAVPTLDALVQSSHEVVSVVAQPDRPAGRGMKLRPPAVAEAARRHGIDLRQPAKIRDDGFLDAIRALRPDAGIVVAYGKILPAALLEIPPHGFLNVHASLLPLYRGAAPIQRAIEHGDRTTGVSIMRLDEELDHGPVFDILEVPIGPDERTPSLFERLAAAGGPLLVSVLDRLERDGLAPREQDHARATLAPKIAKDEGRVTWAESSGGLYDRFRAFWPWPGTFATIGDEMVKLIEIRPAAASGEAGTILAVDGDDVVVANQDGSTRISQVQRPGGRPIAAAELVRARDLGPGDRFA